MVQGILRWLVYGSVFVGVLFLLLLVSRHNYLKRLADGIQVLLLGITPFVVGSLVNRWLGQGHEGQAFAEGLQRNNYFVFQVGIAVVIGFTFMKALEVVDILAIATAIVVSLLMFNSRIGDAIVTSTYQYIVFLSVLVIVIYVICKSLLSSRELPLVSSGRSLSFIAICLSGLLALRLDGMQTGGGWFHVSYFLGVIQGVKSGGLLLWDTPSQYGFLNLLIPALIPGLNAEYSFLLFQAFLLFGVSSVTVFSFNRLAPTGGSSILGVVFIVIFFFADPSLIGPQPFPSSSVMRFGPSVLLLLFLNLRDQKPFITPSRDLTLAIAVAAAVLWSFESAFYSLMIFGMWTLAKTTSSVRRNEFLWIQLRPQVLSALSTIILILLYSLYVFLRVHEVPTWKWFYLAAVEFAAGFGQLPTDLWGAGWLILIAILGCLLLLANASESEKAPCFASVGALLGWLTYYVGRSHSSNIIAMLPLIFVAAVIPMLKHITNYSKCQSTSLQEFRKSMSVSLAVLVVLSGVVVAEVITSPLLPTVVGRARPLPLQAVYEPAASFPDSLEDLLVSVELKRIPVAYQGHMGMLPRLPNSLRERLDSRDTWLPSPLGLLEQPIPESVRSQMLERRFRRRPTSGYFVWHKSMSELGRAELWLDEISKTHDCRVIAEDVDWQVSECLVRTR